MSAPEYRFYIHTHTHTHTHTRSNSYHLENLKNLPPSAKPVLLLRYYPVRLLRIQVFSPQASYCLIFIMVQKHSY